MGRVPTVIGFEPIYTNLEFAILSLNYTVPSINSPDFNNQRSGGLIKIKKIIIKIWK